MDHLQNNITKGATTRRRIVEQAILLFAGNSPEAISLKDIAAKVEISEPAIYRHFPSKGELIWQIFSEGYCRLGDMLEQAQQAEPTLRGKLDRIIGVYCKLHDTDQALFRFLLLTQHGQLARITPDMPNPVEVVARVIAKGMAGKEIPKRDPQLMTALLFGLVTQPAVFHIYGRVGGKMSRYRRILSNATWAVLNE